MFALVGEALWDLVEETPLRFQAVLGGSALNTARLLARLGRVRLYTELVRGSLGEGGGTLLSYDPNLRALPTSDTTPCRQKPAWGPGRSSPWSFWGLEAQEPEV